MLHGFQTDDEVKAKAATIIYAVYKSRDKGRGPSGLDMWGQIERFARSAAKRATGVDDFVGAFKRKMGCSTINPYWLKSESAAASGAMMFSDGTIITQDIGRRDFGLEIFEPESAEEARDIVECIYGRTQIVILLVRDRLERERAFKDYDLEED